MGQHDSIFGQFRETARCRDAQHGDGVCCAFSPQLIYLFISTQDLQVPSADRRETLPPDWKLGVLYNANPLHPTSDIADKPLELHNLIFTRSGRPKMATNPPLATNFDSAESVTDSTGILLICSIFSIHVKLDAEMYTRSSAIAGRLCVRRESMPRIAEMDVEMTT